MPCSTPSTMRSISWASAASSRSEPYRPLRELGEGGCGIAYLAEQLAPVKRHVALKIIKPGMDTKAVVARFEAERQLLALMDHPNVAKVFDAGSTADGPTLLRDGTGARASRITEYCDQLRLSIAERLQLFMQVCQAIQHAHHKGVMHRDIKPSNVLVTMHDGLPVAEGHRLRHRQGDARAAERADAAHRNRSVHRHACLHQSRADRSQPTQRRHSQRHLQSRSAAL